MLLGGAHLAGRLRRSMRLSSSPPAPSEEGGRLYIGKEGDAIRADVPPPPGGRRLFVQAGVGQPGVRSYRYHTGIAIPEVVSYYLGEMPRLGWRRMDRESRGYSEEYPGEILVFSQGRRSCYIAVSAGRVDPGTMVSVVVR